MKDKEAADNHEDIYGERTPVVKFFKLPCVFSVNRTVILQISGVKKPEPADTTQKTKGAFFMDRQQKIITIIVMLLACAILLAGCGANGAVGSGNENRSYITREEAQNIALREAGVSTEDAVFENKEFDLEDGSPVYELEFQANGVEYEYDIHAETGEILRAEQDVQRQRT